ncbi:unnamed protein product [Closterium sp. Naga37s-1]|nr:unnamed protein product [Closterium sp. Naga37s-1]
MRRTGFPIREFRFPFPFPPHAHLKPCLFLSLSAPPPTLPRHNATQTSHPVLLLSIFPSPLPSPPSPHFPPPPLSLPFPLPLPSFPAPRSPPPAQVWFRNVPHTTIADNKRNKNWMARQGDRWHFPGGGSMFPDGVEGYLYHLRQIVELGPNVRTALDIGSGVSAGGRRGRKGRGGLGGEGGGSMFPDGVEGYLYHLRQIVELGPNVRTALDIGSGIVELGPNVRTALDIGSGVSAGGGRIGRKGREAEGEWRGNGRSAMCHEGQAPVPPSCPPLHLPASPLPTSKTPPLSPLPTVYQMPSLWRAVLAVSLALKRPPCPPPSPRLSLALPFALPPTFPPSLPSALPIVHPLPPRPNTAFWSSLVVPTQQVASFGAALLDYGVLTMSIAPKDSASHTSPLHHIPASPFTTSHLPPPFSAPLPLSAVFPSSSSLPAPQQVASFGAALLDYGVLTMSIGPKDSYRAHTLPPPVPYSLPSLVPFPRSPVASFGAALLDYGVLTMSIAPKDSYRAHTLPPPVPYSLPSLVPFPSFGAALLDYGVLTMSIAPKDSYRAHTLPPPVPYSLPSLVPFPSFGAALLDYGVLTVASFGAALLDYGVLTVASFGAALLDYGVASFGAALLDYGVLTMSIAPKDSYRAHTLPPPVPYSLPSLVPFPSFGAALLDYGVLTMSIAPKDSYRAHTLPPPVPYSLPSLVPFPSFGAALLDYGVASFGAALLDYGVLTMSIAPKDSYRAQIQFALERGLPAMIGLLATHRLPFPARSFDLIHCSRCSASFGDENSTHVYEVDRLLRPNGVFILAGQPVAWRGKIAEWKRLRLLGKALCWELLKTVGNVAVWRKLGGDACRVGVEGDGRDVPLCSPALDPDDACDPIHNLSEPCVISDLPYSLPAFLHLPFPPLFPSSPPFPLPPPPFPPPSVFPVPPSPSLFFPIPHLTRYVKLQPCAVPSAPPSWPTPPWPMRLHTPSPRVQLALPASSKASLSDWLAESSENGQTSASSSSSSSSASSAAAAGAAGGGSSGGLDRAGLNGERGAEGGGRGGGGGGGAGDGGEGDDNRNVVGRVELASAGAVKVVVDGILAQGGKEDDAEEDRESGRGGGGGARESRRDSGNNPQRRLLLSVDEEREGGGSGGGGGGGGGETEQFKLLSLERKRWRRRLLHYQKLFLGPLLSSGRVRNVLDMNAGIGGLAAALEDEQLKAEREREMGRGVGRGRGRELQQQQEEQQRGGVSPVWVMNVVPSTGPNTLPAIYDRGLVGTVHDWCESFSSYPRTYDLIHLLSTAPLMPSKERCEIADIVVEMDRLLRPGGTVIVRDLPGPLAVVAQAARAAQWSLAFFPPETKKSPERILVATKPVPAGFEGTDSLGGDGESDGEGEVEGSDGLVGGGEGGDGEERGGGGRRGSDGEGGAGGGVAFEGRSGMAHAAAAAAAAAIDAKAGRSGNN